MASKSHTAHQRGKIALTSSMRWKAPICPSSRWRPKPFPCLRWTLPLCRAFLRSPKPPMPTALWPDRRRRRCRSRTRYTSRAGRTGRVSCALGSRCCGRACCLTWPTTPPPPPSLVPHGSHGWGMRGIMDSRDGEGVREKEVAGAGRFLGNEVGRSIDGLCWLLTCCPAVAKRWYISATSPR